MPNYTDYGTMAYSGYNAKRAVASEKMFTRLLLFCSQYQPKYTINSDGSITCYWIDGSIVDCPPTTCDNVDLSQV